MNQIMKKQFNRQDVEDWRRCQKAYVTYGTGAVNWFKFISIAWKRSLWQISYDSVEEYCEKELGRDVRQIQQILADNRFLDVLRARIGRAPQANDTLPTSTNLSQHAIRQLRRLPGSEHLGTLAEATELAGGHTPQAKHVKAATDRRLGGTAAAPPVTDARGSPVTDPKFREVFTHGAKFLVFGRHVAAIKGMLREILEGPAGSVLAEQRQDIERDRQNILSAIKFSRPYAVCPYCGGNRDDCTGCKGRGWVTKEAWDQSPAKADP